MFSRTGGGDAMYIIAAVLVEEQDWPGLMNYIRRERHMLSVDFIAEQEKYLAADYSSELAGMYADGVLSQLNGRTGRKHYQYACRYIRRMKKMGAEQEAETLMQHMRETYPKRRALLEELDKV